MKRIIGVILITIVLMLGITATVSAASLGISPSHIEVEVPSGGNTPVEFQVHYFSGELSVVLVDIPLEIEPTVFHISSSPTDIIVNFHSSTIEPQEYNGYVKFLSTGNNTVSMAVNIVAKVTVGLSANIVEPPKPSGGGGGGSVPTPPRLVTSPDRATELTIPLDTTIKDKDGKRIYPSSIKIKDNPNPPAPPSNTSIIGLAYNFEPTGATFDPPITLTFNYDPSQLPGGTNENDLVVAFYDEKAGEWVSLKCEVDAETNTITALVSHFTTFAVIVEKQPIEPTPSVVEPKPEPESIPPAPEQEPIQPSPETEKIPPVGEYEYTPPPTLEPVPYYPVPPTTTTNWWLISGTIILAIAIIAILVMVLRWRFAAKT